MIILRKQVAYDRDECASCIQMLIRIGTRDIIISDNPVVFKWTLPELNHAIKIDDNDLGFHWACVHANQFTEQEIKDAMELYKKGSETEDMNELIAEAERNAD